MSGPRPQPEDDQTSPTKPTDEVIRRVCLGGMRDMEEGRQVLTYLRWLERRPVMDNGQVLYMGLARSVIDRILRVDAKIQPADECDILQRLECLIQERDRLREALQVLRPGLVLDLRYADDDDDKDAMRARIQTVEEALS